uniref:USP domain-containing protein n=1 Tax=viral metagenome TaxID=1070528 RepID=A0A6C0HEG1_9ZZZZ
MSEDSQNMRGILGIANLGNTCFMNAALQALRHSPEWTLFCTKDKIKDHIKDTTDSSTIMLMAYQDLVKTIWGGSGPGYVRPLDFYQKLRSAVHKTIYEEFSHRTAQDAHEFLVWLLDHMYMATQKKVSINITNSSSLSPMIIKSLEGWKSAFENQYSPMTDLFFGMYRIQYNCKGCSAVHSRWETFNVLKISPGHKSIQEALEHEFKEEIIEGYDCDACKSKTETVKSVSIWRLPKVLIITLKRFTPMGGRDNSNFDYDGSPVNLDPSFSPESQHESRKKIYNIFASIDHHGNHMGGHYTSQCFNPVWKKWHLYDDEAAHDIEKPNFGIQTYILFFRY